MALRKNLIANYLGQGWVALMGLAFIPLYIKYLGIEAYGLIGLFALVQALLSFLDMGITPMLGREMARFKGGGHSAHSIRDLLRSIEIIALGIAVFLGGGIALAANWIASSWLHAEGLTSEVVAQAFMVMGLVIAIRFMESVYRSSIIGLQRQVIFNVVNSVMATFRSAGAIAVLIWVSASIEAFFIWQGVVSGATLLILALATYASLPRAKRAARFSFNALCGVWKFAGGMFCITLLALLLTQVDKILLSKLLSLSEYGYYTLAAVVAGALHMVITPITQAFYPRLCELHAYNDQVGLVEAFHKGAQLVSVLAGSIAIIVILFAETFLRVWTQDSELTQSTANLLRLLMLGNLLNGLMWMPYQIQLAHGWTSLTLRMNIVAVAVIVPTILWVTPRFGAVGAAWVWVALNAGYIIIGIHFMHYRILVNEKWRWYVQDVSIPLMAGIVAGSLFKLYGNLSTGIVAEIIQLTLVSLITFAAALLSASKLRISLRKFIFGYEN